MDEIKNLGYVTSHVSVTSDIILGARGRDMGTMQARSQDFISWRRKA